MQTNKMAEIIYDYFSSRIKFGYFRQGDQLPSISLIRKQFGVSALTVRAALQQMKEEGYIETAERIPATVIYQPDKKTEQQYFQYFLSRREGMEDICHSSDIIFGPIIHQYFQKYDKASIKRMRFELKKADFRTEKPIIMFYAETMLPLNNPLIMNLYWEIVRYLSTPYLAGPCNFEEANSHAFNHVERILDFLEATQVEQAAKEAEIFNQRITYQFLKRIHSFFQVDGKVEQIPFSWHIYRDHPQLCYSLAAEIMSKINKNIYRKGKFLPSCRALSVEYGVSFITARRTVSLLNDMGVTETLNGVGARVIPETETALPDFCHLQIRKSLLLFLQAMQLASLTCNNVAIHTLSSLGCSQSLQDEIQSYLDTKTTYLMEGACLRFIGENSPSPFVREVYNQQSHLLLWGHSLHMFFEKPEDSDFYETYSVKLIEALQNCNFQRFGNTLSEMVSLGVDMSKKLLIQLNFDESQLL